MSRNVLLALGLIVGLAAAVLAVISEERADRAAEAEAERLELERIEAERTAAAAAGQSGAVGGSGSGGGGGSSLYIPQAQVRAPALDDDLPEVEPDPLSAEELEEEAIEAAGGQVVGTPGEVPASEAPAAGLAALREMTPETVDFDQINSLIQSSSLNINQKFALETALRQARENPETTAAFLQSVQSALGATSE